jgi:coronin-1B/1C/6
MPQLEKDPLESKEADFAVDLKQLDGYTLKSSGTFVGRDKDRTSVSKNSISLAKKFTNKLRAKKQNSQGESVTTEGDAIKEENEEEEEVKEAEIVKDKEEKPVEEKKEPVEEKKEPVEEKKEPVVDKKDEGPKEEKVAEDKTEEKTNDKIEV